MFFLYLIFALFLIEGIRIYCRIQKDKKAARMTIFGDPVEIKRYVDWLKDKKKGGRLIKQKHFNGRFYW